MPVHKWTLLTSLIIANQYKRIVEIGPSKGVTTYAVADGLTEARYAVDSYIGIDPFLDTYYAMDEKMKKKLALWLPWQLFKVTSDEALPSIIAPELVFIDGSHEIDQMSRDIKNYGDKLVFGGCLVGHDYRNPLLPELTDFLHEYIGEKNLNFIEDNRYESGKPNYLWWTYKVEKGHYAKGRPYSI